MQFVCFLGFFAAWAEKPYLAVSDNPSRSNIEKCNRVISCVFCPATSRLSTQCFKPFKSPQLFHSYIVIIMIRCIMIVNITNIQLLEYVIPTSTQSFMPLRFSPGFLRSSPPMRIQQSSQQELRFLVVGSLSPVSKLLSPSAKS